MNAQSRALLLAAAFLAVSPAMRAQENHEEHHPPGTAASPAPVQKPAGKPSPGSMGMMDGGMMGHRDGMRGGGMMSMMGDDMPMMGMMMEHTEGYLSFLKTELKITDAQAAQWNAFSEVQRANAGAMKDMRAGMMPKPGSMTFPERLALHEKAMTAHLDALRREKGAVTDLYGVLSDDQKKTADELLSRSMGMM